MMTDSRAIASNRTNLHIGHASRRALSKDYDLVGVAGELEFSRMFGLSVDTSQRVSGDKGVDFILPTGATVDVKTYRKPYNLIVEQDHIYADVYVLAQFIDKTEKAKLIGWASAGRIKRAPKRDFGYQIINHYIDANNLSNIVDLLVLFPEKN